MLLEEGWDNLERTICFGDYFRECLSVYYDLLENSKARFDFIARYNERNSAYALKKELEYYAFENNEIIFYEKLDHLDEEKLMDIENIFYEGYEDYISKGKDHMATAMYYVIEVDSLPDEAVLRRVKKFRFYKSFRLGFEGWVNGSIIVINSGDNYGTSNPFGKRELKRILKIKQKFLKN